MTANSIRTATVTTASSDGSQPAYSDIAPPGTNPAQPTITLSPDAGLNTGGNRVVINGLNLGGATAIFLGSPEETATGQGTLLQPCATTASPCFTVDSANEIVVDQWPPHATADVLVTVVALGVPSNSVTYTYAAFTEGALLVTELRLSGPAGNGDEYVELTNTTAGRLPLAGIAIQTASGGNVVLRDDAGSLPAGGTYLVTGPSYSLSAVAPADLTSSSPLGTGGVRVLSPGANPLVVDAVGPADTTEGFFEGQGLPTFDSDPQAEFAWVRTQQSGEFKNAKSAALLAVLIDVTEVNGLASLTIPPGSPLANLRAVAPQSPTVTVNGRTVQNVAPAFPSVPGLGGGLNSTFTVPLSSGGLAPGDTAVVGLTFDASTNGKFTFRYATEALLAS